MSSTKSSESSLFGNALDLADSTVRFGFLFVAEVFETAAEIADSRVDGERRYTFKGFGDRLNQGLKKFTGTMDELAEFLIKEEKEDGKKPESGSTSKAQ